MKDSAQFGLTYLVEVIRDGVVVDREEVHNLVPTQGLNHILNVEFKALTQVTAWYLAIFEGNYVPTAADTAAALPAASTESTAYGEATRVLFAGGTVAGGVLDNSASRAEFTMNATKTIYGAYMSSAPAKGATTGVVISSVRFSSAKNLVATDILRITAGMTLTSS